MTSPHQQAPAECGVELVVDAANVVGARPDGWWRDRAGAADRLLLAVSGWAGRVVQLPTQHGTVRIDRTHAVLEGAARSATLVGVGPDVLVHLAPRDGDTTIVAVACALVAEGRTVVVVSADRGLLARLPPGVRTAGPGWFRDLIDAEAASSIGVGVERPES